VITLARKKLFGLVYVGQKGPIGDEKLGRAGEASSVVISTIHRTSFVSLTALLLQMPM
jgi:hypothetical protein